MKWAFVTDDFFVNILYTYIGASSLKWFQAYTTLSYLNISKLFIIFLYET